MCTSHPATFMLRIPHMFHLSEERTVSVRLDPVFHRPHSSLFASQTVSLNFGMNAGLAQCGRPQYDTKYYQVTDQPAALVLLLTHRHLLVCEGEAANISSTFCLLEPLKVFMLSVQFFSLLATWLTLYVLLKKSKYTLVKSTPRTGGQQICSCYFSSSPTERRSQSGIISVAFRRPLLQSTLLAVDLHWVGQLLTTFLRRVGPVSSVRSSSTERDDRRQTWTSRRLCRTPQVRGDAVGERRRSVHRQEVNDNDSHGKC